MSDENDAKGGIVYYASVPKLTARMPVERYASEYNMKHKHRGQAHIFSHEYFDNKELKSRPYTVKDSECLYSSLTKLHFEVHIHKDKKLKEIQAIVEGAARADHTDSDCILIAVLSHGDMGYINAKDAEYKLDLLANCFTAENCETLAGKPKLFFIQACQGRNYDAGITLRKTETECGGSCLSYRIPIHADFLFAYSTIPGYVSWANNPRGAWFIQCLCKELDVYGKSDDILTLLTFVCQRVAWDFESNTPDEPKKDQKKQVSCTTTMLTRILRFIDK